MLKRILRTGQKLTPLVRARKERRQYTVEELSNNKWHFPDEDCSVKKNATKFHFLKKILILLYQISKEKILKLFKREHLTLINQMEWQT